VAKVALRNKESLCVLRATDSVLMLETLFYPDEVRTQDLQSTPEVLVSQPELNMALSFVEMLEEPFDPVRYQDNYRAALLEVIEAKRTGSEVVAQPETPMPQTVDLMAALKASLEAARKGKADAAAAEEPAPISAKARKGKAKDADESEDQELAVAF
jgi:DNA end-binding protein Ku